MAVNTIGRARKANWGEVEIYTLVEECAENVKLIYGNHGEVKQTDKSDFWRKITERISLLYIHVPAPVFMLSVLIYRINSVGTGGRTVEEVKYKWKHLKSDTKKKEQHRRREMQKTGGGGAVSALKGWEGRIISVIPTVSVEGLQDGEDIFLNRATREETPIIEEEDEIVVIAEPEFIVAKEQGTIDPGTIDPVKPKNLKRSLEEYQCQFYQSNIALNKKKIFESDQRIKLMATQEELFRVATQKLKSEDSSSLEDIFNMITEQ